MMQSTTMKLVWPVRAICLFAVIVQAVSAAGGSGKCSRKCMTRVLEQYLDAVLKHDPAGAPLAPSFRYTENAEVVRPGDGLWKTASGLGKVQRRYIDPVNGQAVYFGHVIETGAAGDATNLAMLRIRVVDNKVIEGELVIGRRSDGLFNPDGLIANPPPDKPVSRRLRSSRVAMVAAAQSYFDGIQSHDSSRVLGMKGCERIENGVMTAGPTPGPAPFPSLAASGPPVKGDCGSFMEDFKATISEVNPRRFPVVDEQAGVVLGIVVFNRPPGAKRSDGAPFPRNLLTEILAIEGGRIRGIYAAMHYLSPDNPNAPGWD